MASHLGQTCGRALVPLFYFFSSLTAFFSPAILIPGGECDLKRGGGRQSLVSGNMLGQVLIGFCTAERGALLCVFLGKQEQPTDTGGWRGGEGALPLRGPSLRENTSPKYVSCLRR